MIDAAAGIDWDAIPRPSTCLEAIVANARVRQLVPQIELIAARVIEFCNRDEV